MCKLYCYSFPKDNNINLNWLFLTESNIDDIDNTPINAVLLLNG